MIWFWAGVALVSLVLSLGRYAPFYKLFYSLPYASTIRNPIKFMHPFHFSVLVLFGYGLQYLYRQHLAGVGRPGATRLFASLRSLWTGRQFESRWTFGLAVGVCVAAASWLLYLGSTRSLLERLAQAGFPGELGEQIARFSQMEVGLFTLFLLATSLLLACVFSGFFQGKRAKAALVMLGLLLSADLIHANAPWIQYQDTRLKYAGNPVVDFLARETPHHRVTARIYPDQPVNWGIELINNTPSEWPAVCNDWLEHLFPYYTVHTLDIVQMPRRPVLDDAMLTHFRGSAPSTARLWQLTGTRYILGLAGFQNYFNEQADPQGRRFQIRHRFRVAAKPGHDGNRVEELTAEWDPNGPYAVFEFTGALPRVKLYAHWEEAQDDASALARLSHPEFNPETTVIISGKPPQGPAAPSGEAPAGTAEIVRYAPKLVEVKASTPSPAVLLFNDRWHPGWKLEVNGKPATLLRCNHLMRGVFLPPGEHTLSMRFEPHVPGIWVSLLSAGAFVLLSGVVWLDSRKRKGAA